MKFAHCPPEIRKFFLWWVLQEIIAFLWSQSHTCFVSYSRLTREVIKTEQTRLSSSWSCSPHPLSIVPSPCSTVQTCHIHSQTLAVPAVLGIFFYAFRIPVQLLGCRSGKHQQAAKVLQGLHALTVKTNYQLKPRMEDNKIQKWNGGWARGGWGADSGFSVRLTVVCSISHERLRQEPECSPILALCSY